jgi:hypothetical protein
MIFIRPPNRPDGRYGWLAPQANIQKKAMPQLTITAMANGAAL